MEFFSLECDKQCRHLNWDILLKMPPDRKRNRKLTFLLFSSCFVFGFFFLLFKQFCFCYLHLTYTTSSLHFHSMLLWSSTFSWYDNKLKRWMFRICDFIYFWIAWALAVHVQIWIFTLYLSKTSKLFALLGFLNICGGKWCPSTTLHAK